MALRGNSAATGGAISILGTALTIANSVLDSNGATRRGDLGRCRHCGDLRQCADGQLGRNRGGGIHLRNGVTSLSLVDSELRENTAVGTARGGFLTAAGLDTTISRTTIDMNTATREGGLYWDVGDGSLAASESTFSRTRASDESGELWTERGTLTLTNTTLGENDSAARGEAIHQDGGQITRLNVTIAMNSSSPGGAALPMGVLRRRRCKTRSSRGMWAATAGERSPRWATISTGMGPAGSTGRVISRPRTRGSGRWR